VISSKLGLRANRMGSKESIAIGAGYIALDIISGLGEAVLYSAGGSCANVLSVLQLLGWRSIPIGRLGSDFAGRLIVADLQRQGLDTSLLTLAPEVRSPRVLELIPTGSRHHRFLFRCLSCGRDLPRFQPPTRESMRLALRQAPTPQVFVFDRTSRGILDAATWAREAGAIAFFMPNGIGRAKLFREALEVSHIVQYSREKLAQLADSDMTLQGQHALEVETLGADGLRYRTRHGAWRYRPPFRVASVADAAGAGDWLAAGTLSQLKEPLTHDALDEGDVEAALRFGQALASLKCRYVGARGLALTVPRSDLLAQVQKVIACGGVPGASSPSELSVSRWWPRIPQGLCPYCLQGGGSGPASIESQKQRSSQPGSQP